ncbi:MAG: DUF427 domain-containing protein [Nitrososphaerales archaeon]
MISIEPSPKIVKVIFGKKTLAISKRVLLVWQNGGLPVYYFPMEDVRMEFLTHSGRLTKEAGMGTKVSWNIAVGRKRTKAAAWSFENLPSSADGIREHVAFSWSAMDSWHEEDEEVFVHPRDPHKRIDVLQSSRNIKVLINGKLLAESSSPMLLFETGLPTRYYLEMKDFRTKLLPSARTTMCPYKGEANYWSVTAEGQNAEDLVWGYKEPLPECGKIAGLFSFYNEKVDLYVEGVLQERPKLRWKKPS